MSARSLNPAIDIGQIEGGFVQGMGWLTTEELVCDEEGRLLTHAPSTYKIPVAADVPADFRVALFDRRQSRGHDLSLEGGRRAAADAGDFRVLRDHRRGPFAAPGNRSRSMPPQRRRRSSRRSARSTQSLHWRCSRPESTPRYE